MSDQSHSHNNLVGWERALSIAAGLAIAVRGADTGGAVGACKAGLGGLMVMRGVRGHCTAKGLLMNPEEELLRISGELRRLSARLESMAVRYAQFKRERDLALLATRVREVERVAEEEVDLLAETEAAGFDLNPPKP